MFMKYDSSSITAWTAGLMALQASRSWASNKASTVRSTAFSGVRFGKCSFVILQPFSFKHFEHKSVELQSYLAFFVKLTWSLSIATLTRCFLFPSVSLTAGRPLNCKLFFCGTAVLQVLKNFVNRGFGRSQLLEGFDSGLCAKRVIN